jgi:DNA-binding NtrC family response regulator
MATYAPPDDLPGGAAFEPDDTLDLRSRLLAYERHLITAALAEAGGNQRRAARLLGILPTTLHEKRKRLGLRGPASPDGVTRDSRETSA